MKILHLFAFIVLSIGMCLGENTSLDKILLIINYNHAHYASMPLLKDIYRDYFESIIFYGPAQHKGVHYYPHDSGYLSYMCIADAMKKYPDFEGYLFLHDDCILHAWMLTGLDQTKIWCPMWQWLYSDTCDFIDITKGEKAYDWYWWKSGWGRSPMTNAFNNMPTQYKQMLAQNVGPSHVVSGYSDFVYIPGQYKEQYIELANIFGGQKAFLELALPTITHCLSLRSEWVWLPGHNSYANGSRDLKPDIYLNHPIKLSSAENRAYVIELFDKMKKIKG